MERALRLDGHQGAVLGQRGAEPYWLGDALRTGSPPLDRASGLTSPATVIRPLLSLVVET